MLSGGLNAGNVADAIQVARPAAVDVSSGVEIAPGQKSVELIDAFVNAARQAAAVPAMAVT
jgi:phosphoribosylanthranilate isomerase